MKSRFRLFILIFTSFIITAITVGCTLLVLYNASFNQQEARLVEMVDSHAHFIKSVAEYDRNDHLYYHRNDTLANLTDEQMIQIATKATLSQIEDAFLDYNNLDETGEFTIATLSGDNMVYLLPFRHDADKISPIFPISSKNAEPMRRALRGESGTMMGLDYRGEEVLAAYRPVNILGLGIVAKIDMAEVRGPFLQAEILAIGIACAVLLLGTIFLFLIGNPLVRGLNESENRYRQLFTSGYDAIILFDAETARVIDINPAAEKLYGYIREEFLKQDVISISAEPEKTETAWGNIVNGNNQDIISRRHKKKDGTEFYVDISPSIFNMNNQRVVCAIFRDMTRQMRIRKELEDSREKYRSLTSLAPVGVYQTDIDGSCVYANKKACELTGLSAAELLGEGWVCAIHPDDRDRVSKEWNYALETDTGFQTEYRFLTPDGRVNWVEGKAEKLFNDKDEISGFIGTIIDISERKQAEDAMFLKNKIFENMREAVVIIRASDEVIVEVSPKFEDMFGYAAGEMVNQHASILNAPGEYGSDEMSLKIIENIEKNGVWEGEVKNIRKNGTQFWSSIRSTKFEHPNFGKVFVTVQSDITNRKLIEESLVKSERQYRELIDSIMEGIALVDSRGVIVYCNPAFASILEAECESDVVGKFVLDLVPDDQKELLEAEKRTHRKGISDRYEHDMITLNGNRITVLVSASPRLDEEGQYVGEVAAMIDITETKRLQQLETRAERLETAGQIAGQVAHDFNNLLAPLMAFPDLIRMDLPENHQILNYIDSIESAAAKMADINQQLLTLGRRGHYNLKPLNLNELVRLVVKEIEPMPDNIACNLNLDENLMNFLGGNAQVYRVVANLLHNAIDAIDNSGTITIITENYYADDVSVAYNRVPKGEYIKLTIADTGCGIPDDIIQKIFDPFFTTKSADKKRGSGLGMSVVDAVMKDHNGYLDLISEVGKGTSFYLYFPITREECEDISTSAMLSGHEKILVVDDDRIQRVITRQLLTRQGYKVNEVESGEDAIEFLKNNPHDLLVLDMIMPDGIDGTETYKEIVKFSPNQKAIIVSGYSETERVVEAREAGVGAFIKKPITMNTISVAVRRELDKGAMVRS